MLLGDPSKLEDARTALHAAITPTSFKVSNKYEFDITLTPQLGLPQAYVDDPLRHGDVIAELFLAAEDDRHRPFYRVDPATGQTSDEPE